ncbi:MAG: arsinothricin resistance N-acetyltransferase ArsN1 family B [Byssovorax sp.]
MTRSPPDITIRSATAEDAAEVARIYNPYVEETVITFEEEPVSPAEMARRIAEVQDASLPWLVAEAPGRLAGYAYAARWKTRASYRFSVEITVYVAGAEVGRGVGVALYETLFPALKARNVHAVMAGIALPNDPSIRLHERFGMQKVAHFQEVGLKLGRWVDVAYWERTL